MATVLIYESPKKEKLRSAPIAETDTAARTLLEARGWRIVERREEASPEAVVVAPLAAPVVEGKDPFADYRDTLKDEQWAALTGAGYTTPDAIRAASDDDLRGVPTIGPAALRELRAALAAPAEGE
jgi:hypothetical protein